MAQIEFLRPDVAQIRHQINGILDSYSHEWDLLSELAQNSIDAIRARNVTPGRIDLVIDASKCKISISDNGVGIGSSVLETMLRPFSTSKAGKANQIGAKGVGLKFVIFSSARFEITSRTAADACSSTIEAAAAWAKSDTNNPLTLEKLDTSDRTDSGTTITVTVDDSNHPLFRYSTEELLFLLRVKTALGDTNFIWDSPLDCGVVFTHIDQGGARSQRTFQCKYLLPTEVTKKEDVEKLDDFQNWLIEQDRSDLDKRRKLLNKIVWTQGKETVSGRQIRYWSCFVPRRDFWEKLSERFGKSLITPPLDPEVEGQNTAVGFSGGFQTATKGMPTGISIELKPRGSAGYVPNFFFIVDDPSLKFDIGRKSIHGRQQGALRETAYKVFREYIKITTKYLGGDIDPDAEEYDREAVFDELEQLPNLESPNSRFAKRPNKQEATVAAMFFEALGRGEFEDIKPYISGYKGRYDLYAKVKNKRIVLEFKYDLSSLLKDFDEETKLFNEINVVVLWELTEADRKAASRRGIGIDEIQISSLVGSSEFPNASFRLTLGNVKPIYVVEMKRSIS